MKNSPIPRLDKQPALRERLLKYCRLKPGEIWDDPRGKHRIGCLDAANTMQVQELMAGDLANLAIHDPPYNLIAFEQRDVSHYSQWCQRWIANTDLAMAKDSSLYVWMGADQNCGFQPLPDFMLLMRATSFRPRSFITMRNQRGYGTQQNWMAVRQELLYYVKGEPDFCVEAEYTELPKSLRGYYKRIDGELTENLERSNSQNLRAGNVWIDVQQVFYRMEENVNGCYAQKPLKSCERMLRASSRSDDLVIDFFCHSGSTLLAAEMHDRRCRTMDSDSIYCEIAIRRIERFRATGKTGWQNGNPFEDELQHDAEPASIAPPEAELNGKSQLTFL
jgi:DNA modification methylase